MEQKQVKEACMDACDAIGLMLDGQIQDAMNRFNRKKQVEN